jgi:hypothetical protein
MADQSLKMATCPICGVEETGEDTAALKAEMEDHMRLMHNVVMPFSITTPDLTTYQTTSDLPAQPLIGESPDVPGPSPDFGGARQQ